MVCGNKRNVTENDSVVCNKKERNSKKKHPIILPKKIFKPIPLRAVRLHPLTQQTLYPVLSTLLCPR